MAFIENASLKIKRMQNINALSSEATKLEKSNADLISQLGQTYYETHCNDPQPEFPYLINEITQNKASIARIQEEIQWLKSMLTCRSCGADLKEGQQFCPVCGTRVEREMPRNLAGVTCSNCGAQISDGASFCPKCGMPVSYSQQDATVSTALAGPAAGALVCRNCGKPLRPGAKFCSGCGYTVE